MRALPPLALSSLRARRSTVLLTVVTVALSMALLLGVERLRQEARSSFLRSVSGTDLIVGARAHPVQFLLYSVFRLGDASNNLRWDSVQWLQGNPEVAWSVPISLGDSHRGYRVVGTTADYFKRIGTREQRELAFAAGQPFDALFDVVLGAEVARALSYDIGDGLVLAHGTAQVALQTHEDRPFKVSGILAATGTAIDQALYVSLPALEAIHLNWRSGTRIGEAPDLDTLSSDRLQPRTVTAVFVGLASKTSTFAVQRAINQYGDEPLSAVLPGVALQQLWGMLATIERVLSVAAACVVAAGFMVLLTSVLATLNERRREMAVLRAVASFVLLVWGYGEARQAPVLVWLPPPGLRHAAALLTLPAFVLLVAAYVPRNHLKARLGHPMLLAVKLWAAAHLLVNGWLHGMLLFGAFLVWAVLTFRSARRRAMPASPPPTSALATLVSVLLGVAGWAGFALYLHLQWIGVAPFGR